MPQINCPHCAQPYDIAPDQWPQYQGRSITCTRCNQPFTVTGNAASPAAASLPAHAGAAVYGAPAGQAATGYAPGGYYPPPKKSGMSGLTIGLIVGGVFLVLGVVIMLLIAILLPSLNRAREMANRAKCGNNMRQIAMGCLMYANSDPSGQFPSKINDVLLTQELSPGVFVCPSSTDTPASGSNSASTAANLTAGGHLSYAYVGRGLRKSTAGNAVLLYEPMTNHTKDGSNFVFADGHIEFVNKGQAEQMIKDLEAGKNPPTAAPF